MQYLFDIVITLVCFYASFSLFKFYTGRTNFRKEAEEARIAKIKKYGGLYIIAIVFLIAIGITNLIVSFS